MEEVLKEIDKKTILEKMDGHNLKKLAFMMSEEAYWSERYKNANTGWDIGKISTPLKTYIDQLSDKGTKILIPGAGNGYEAEYLFKEGFTNTYVLDISNAPLENIKIRIPTFPEKNLIHGDFFQHTDVYDIIFEQTFFCSFEPTKQNRSNYARKMSQLLNDKGLLVGLWFKHPYILGEGKRPYGGNKDEYLTYLSPYFNTKSFEDCYNSIPPRAGNELFGIFEKK